MRVTLTIKNQKNKIKSDDFLAARMAAARMHITPGTQEMHRLEPIMEPRGKFTGAFGLEQAAKQGRQFPESPCFAACGRPDEPPGGRRPERG